MKQIINTNAPLTKEEESKYKKLTNEILTTITVATKMVSGAWDKVMVIRDERLYRKEFHTFDQFCQDKLKLTPRRVNQLIGAGLIIKQLPENLGTMVLNERVARELAKVAEPKRAEVVQAASRNGAITAKAVRAASPKLVVDAEEIHKDEMGYIIPKGCVEMWLRRQEVQELLTHISKVRCHLKDAMANNDMLFHSLGGEDGQFLNKLDGIYSRISDCKPYAVCPNCSGTDVTKVQCRACHGTGWLCKYAYDRFPEKGLMKLREIQIKQQEVSK
jgi:hypothetical protein